MINKPHPYNHDPVATPDVSCPVIDSQPSQMSNFFKDGPSNAHYTSAPPVPEPLRAASEYPSSPPIIPLLQVPATTRFYFRIHLPNDLHKIPSGLTYMAFMKLFTRIWARHTLPQLPAPTHELLLWYSIGDSQKEVILSDDTGYAKMVANIDKTTIINIRVYC